MSYGRPGEPAEEWQSPPFFADFYREPDNVCRGLTLPPEDIPVPGQDPFKGFSDGDFYREPDDIHKGISIGGFDHPSLDKDFQFSMGLDFGSSSVLSDNVDIKAQRFMYTDYPPDLPSDSFFKLEVTTVYVLSTNPYEIGNHVLDYLQDPSVISVLTKPVRRHKFAIKADIFRGDLMCTTKIRVYNQGSNQFAVEFQRRAGDSIAFNQTFQGASAYLKKHFTSAGGSPEVQAINFEPPPLPADFAAINISEEDLMPILDMASLAGSPWLQAEAASSLCKLAQDGNPALWSGSVFDSVMELLKANSIEVAQPTARLTHNLAQRAEAAPLFGARNLMLTMLEKIRAQETHAQVSLQLAQALNVAVQMQSKATLSGNAASELLRSLSGIIGKEVGCVALNNDVIDNLHMVKCALESKFEVSV